MGQREMSKESHCFVLGSEADGQHRRGAVSKKAGRIYLGTVESAKSREHSSRNTFLATIHKRVSSEGQAERLES